MPNPRLTTIPRLERSEESERDWTELRQGTSSQASSSAMSATSARSPFSTTSSSPSYSSTPTSPLLSSTSSLPTSSTFSSPSSQPAMASTYQSQYNQYDYNPYEEKFHSEFSFLSLVLGIFGLILPLCSTLAIIFGIAGLMQTHREHMKGRWMAISGIILGFLGIILLLVAIIVGIEFLQSYLLEFGGLETLLG